MAKVSVIIPVYNKGKYLKETLSSIDKQTESDMEIIIIDDGSTDNSIDIIHNLKKDSFLRNNVKIIQNSRNMGVAYSRNLGIEEATSDYITFVDADDLLEKDFIRFTVDKMKKFSDIDLVRGRVLPFKKEAGILSMGKLDDYMEDSIIMPKENPDYIYEEIVSCSGRLYKSDFIKKLKFHESGFEDYEFFLETILECNKILYTDMAQYYYRFISDGKYGTSTFNINEHCFDYFDIYERIMKKYPYISLDMKEEIEAKQVYLCFCYLERIKDSEMVEEDKKQFLKSYLWYMDNKYNLMEKYVSMKLEPIDVPIDDVDAIKQKIKQIAMKY